MDHKNGPGLLIIDLTAVGVTKMTEEMVPPQMAKQLVVVKKSGIAELTHRVTFVRSEKVYSPNDVLLITFLGSLLFELDFDG